MKLYLDEDMSPKVAQALRERGYDVTSSHEVGNDGLSDAEQLRYATGQGRYLVTYNRRDYLALADQWFRRGKHFTNTRRTGTRILLMLESRYRRSNIGAQARALERYLAAGTEDPNPMDCVEYV